MALTTSIPNIPNQGRQLRSRYTRDSSSQLETPNPDGLPHIPVATGLRRSQRLLQGGETRTFVERFLGHSETEEEDDNDGLEFDFCWDRGEF